MTNLFLLLDINGIITLAVGILGGGLLSSVIAFRKAKPEISRITVEVAGQAVIVQKGVIDSLQNELIRVAADLRSVEAENDKCQKENREFRITISDLQNKLLSHSARMDKIEEKQT